MRILVRPLQTHDPSIVLISIIYFAPQVCTLAALAVALTAEKQPEKRGMDFGSAAKFGPGSLGGGNGGGKPAGGAIGGDGGEGLEDGSGHTKIPKPHPVHVAVNKVKLPVKVPVSVEKPPYPVTTPVKVAHPVPKPIEGPMNVSVVAPRHYPVKTVHVPKPAPVDRPNAVPVDRPYPVSIPRPVPVHAPQSVAVPHPQPVPVVKKPQSNFNLTSMEILVF
ncbi:tetra-peptide repeat homeobox protein 1-like [Cloeon dipterum]|uniref:tetra-peptide repeat homeobox protein 1-like n=1 Tax=Cloeon dipterum TaxID=197152 RepID=UPI00321F9616